MTTTTTYTDPITGRTETATTKGEFAGVTWELWQHPDAPGLWGYTLTWGTWGDGTTEGEYESDDFRVSPHEARRLAFVRIAEHDAADVAQSDKATPPEPEQEYGYVIVSTGGRMRTSEEWQVHAEGCRDVARLERAGCDSWHTKAPSAEALVDAEVQVYTDQDQGWSHDDHRIMPCCQHARTA